MSSNWPVLLSRGGAGGVGAYVTHAELDTALGDMLPLAGGAMSGVLDMGGYAIIQVGKVELFTGSPWEETPGLLVQVKPVAESKGAVLNLESAGQLTFAESQGYGQTVLTLEGSPHDQASDGEFFVQTTSDPVNDTWVRVRGVADGTTGKLTSTAQHFGAASARASTYHESSATTGWVEIEAFGGTAFIKLQVGDTVLNDALIVYETYTWIDLKLGINTASPTYELDIASADSGDTDARLSAAGAGDDARLRLEGHTLSDIIFGNSSQAICRWDDASDRLLIYLEDSAEASRLVLACYAGDSAVNGDIYVYDTEANNLVLMYDHSASYWRARDDWNPYTTNTYNMGTAAIYWKNVYSAAYPAVSDERTKTDLEPLRLGLGFLETLGRSSRYHRRLRTKQGASKSQAPKLKFDERGRRNVTEPGEPLDPIDSVDKRWTFGWTAQHMEAALTEHRMKTSTLVHPADPKVPGSMAMTEQMQMIPILSNAILELNERLAVLEAA